MDTFHEATSVFSPFLSVGLVIVEECVLKSRFLVFLLAKWMDLVAKNSLKIGRQNKMEHHTEWQ